MQNRSVSIYGDGKQVRDVLYIDDLICAYEAAIENIVKTKGQVYNIGGGPQNTLSLLELIDILERNFGRKLKHDYDKWRPGDQLIYVSNIEKANKDFGWKPNVNPIEGVSRLIDWLKENQHIFE